MSCPGEAAISLHLRYTAAGGSMAPLVRRGDTLTLAPLDRPPRVGEILVVPGAGGLVAHRVVRVRGSGNDWRATLRGDARSADDGEVGARAVLGRVAAQARGGRILDHSRLAVRVLGAIAARVGGARLSARLARKLLDRIACALASRRS